LSKGASTKVIPKDFDRLSPNGSADPELAAATRFLIRPPLALSLSKGWPHSTVRLSMSADLDAREA
jgi:hypothetical protein